MSTPTASPPASHSAGDGSALKSNSISARHLVFFVVAAAAPLTVMAGFAPLAFLVGGQVAPVGYLAAGLVYMLFAVGFVTMSRHVRNAGAFYGYIREGLGKEAGGGAAAVAWTAYTLGQIGFCAAAGLFASNALDQFLGLTISWGVCALVIGAAVVAVSWANVMVGARVAAVLLITEIGILVVLLIAIVVKGTPAGYSLEGFNPSNWTASLLGGLFVITFVVYIGFEQTAVYSEEVKDPARTIPRATYIAVGLLALIYTVASWLLLMALGPDGLAKALSGDVSTLVFDVNNDYVGKLATDVMQILVVTSFIAGVLALQNAGARYLFSMGRDGLLPARLTHTGPTGSPRTAVLVQGAVFLAVLAGFIIADRDPYTEVVIWTNTPTLVGVLALQIVTSIAIVKYFASDRRGEGMWKTSIAPTAATVVLAVIFWLVCTKMGTLTALGTAGNIWINVPLVVGLIVGVVRARSATPHEQVVTR